MAFQKLIPALMAGNSVILRPSPLTPISSLVLGSAADAAGLPAGVLSVVVEAGSAGAEILTTDPAVDMVSFTGSTAVGQADPGAGGADGEAGGTGTGRQVGPDLPSRRRRAGRCRGRRGRRDDGGAGVRGRHADAGAGGAQGRGDRGGLQGLRRHRRRSAHRSDHDDGPGHQCRRSGNAASDSWRWPRSTAARWSSAGAARRR